jgi:DNA repair protein RadC
MTMNELKSVLKVRLKQVRDGRVKFKVNKVSSPLEVFEAVRPYYRQADREMLSVLCLDTQNQPTSFNIVSVGGLNTTRTRPAEILKPALLSNAQGIILIHNHPSGNTEASPEDIEFTKAVGRACEILGLELHDHLIVTDGGFSSLREHGLL